MPNEKQTLRGAFREKMDNATEIGNAQARMNFLQKLMDAEGWTYEQALTACIGKDRVPKYSLYYKMADIDVTAQLMTKKGKLRFADTLPDDEREIFLAEMGQVKVKREMAKQVGKLPVDKVKTIRKKMKENKELRKKMKEAAKDSMEEE